MGIKIKNLQTGEFEKFNIPALKGEKGEPGEIEPSEKVDYIGKQHSKLRDTMNANVDYIIKTAIGEFNYLDYEGQHITATNSIEGHARSAILKGKTLVNLKTLFMNSVSYIDGQFRITFKDVGNFNKLTIKNKNSKTIRFSYYVGNWKHFEIESMKSVLISNIPSEVITYNIFALDSYGWTLTNFKECMDNVIILEGDYTNVDIPYFEGMQSVKMPVLTTTGKNLFGGELEYGDFNNSTGIPTNNSDRIIRTREYNRISPNKTYNLTVFNAMKTISSYCIHEYDNDFNYIKTTDSNVFTTSDNTKYIKFRFRKHDSAPFSNEELMNLSCMIVEGNADSASYEPYKSNILSTSDDVVLRGIGDVQDTLDLLTGEVTERIGEVVLDGSQEMILNHTLDDVLGFYMKSQIVGTSDLKYLMCDKLPVKSIYNVNEEGIRAIGGGSPFRLYFTISKSKLSSYDVDGLNNYLKQNPITVHYQLVTESIKTVDLSDNHVYSYKDTTHYTCSSTEGSLVPTLSVKVPTDTQLTIQEQKATTQTLLNKNMDLQQSIKEVQAMNLAFNTALYNSFNSIREEVEDIKKHVSTNENLEGSF